MPLYEYRCEKCSQSFEELVFGSNPQVQCPKCQGSKVTRQLSTFASHGGAITGPSAAASAPAIKPSGGGGCGGGCGCGH